MIKHIRTTSLLVALIPALSALAADAAAIQDRQVRKEKADALQADGQERQLAAKKRYDEQFAACGKKFLVNDCRTKAHKKYVEESRAAKRTENDGKAIEREVKREELEQRDRERAESAPQREADRETRKAQREAERKEAEAKRETTLAEKAVKSEKNVRRRAEQDARREQKRAEHEARRAEKIERAQRREADSASKN